MRRAPTLAAIALWTALGAACRHSISTPGDAGPDGGSGDGGESDAGSFDGGLPDAGPVPVRVRAIFPGHGPAAGGTNALVSGSGFVEGFASRGGAAVSKVTSVTIGGAAATNVDVIDDNRLQLTLPAGAGGPADVTVTNPNGSGTCTGCYRYQAALSVTAIEPARGPSQGGTAVTVRGQGFANGTLLLVGGRALIGLTIVDAATATGLTPPGVAGGADVRALTRDSSAELRRGFVYADPLALGSADPAVGPTAGGSRLLLTGAGFSALATVALDGADTAAVWYDANHLIALSGPHAAGAVDVAVSDPVAGAAVTLPRGFVYADPGGALLLGALQPRHAPLAGGTCPGACVSLFGSGLSLPDLVVSIAGQDLPPSALHAVSDSRLDVDLPAGAAPGAVEVAVRSAAQSASSAIAAADPGALRYDAALSVGSIAPAQGPAAGGTAIALSGAGFDLSPGAPLEVRIGALPAASVAVAGDGRSLSAIAPAGAPGANDVTVVATDADGHRRAAVLRAGFFYTAPLQLAQVDPASGAQSGGARVTLWGQGFAPGLAVTFGGAPATDVRVLGPSQAIAVVPRGDPGAVEVAATLGTQRDALPEGFTYFDPGSAPGGVSGGPLRGTLNVTVFDSTPYLSGGVKGGLVVVELAGGGRLVGATDDRGQITFSDDRLVLPCRVTATKALYDAITVDAVQVEDVSVYLYGPTPPPPPPPDPPPPPPPPPEPERSATVGGHVWGFKVPPSLVLSPSQRLVARVAQTSSSVYSAPPFALPPKYLLVTQDGGTWSFSTFRLSPTTVYALFGVEDQSTSPSTFTPILMGVRRAIQPDPDHPLTDADIILDTHLDQTVVAQVLGVPAIPGAAVGHDAAVSLDLGNDGVIPLTQVVQSSPLDSLTFDHLPAASGQGFVFADIVGRFLSGTVTTPASTYLRRVFSDPGPGIVLGPMLPFPVITSPADQGTYGGSFSWALDGALQPNLVQVQINGASFQWGVVMPGSARSLQPPAEIGARLSAGNYVWSVTASLSPAFDYAHWAYQDLYSGSWIAYSYDVRLFKVGP